MSLYFPSKIPTNLLKNFCSKKIISVKPWTLSNLRKKRDDFSTSNLFIYLIFDKPFHHTAKPPKKSHAKLYNILWNIIQQRLLSLCLDQRIFLSNSLINKIILIGPPISNCGYLYEIVSTYPILKTSHIHHNIHPTEILCLYAQFKTL